LITLPEANYDVVGSVVAYRTDPAEIQRAVEQFSAVPLKTHLCIIDNSPEPLPLPRFDPGKVSYHFANANLGYGRGHNLALRAARDKTQYSLVMNTDIHYSPEVVLRLRDFLEQHPSASLAAPKIRYPDGSLQYVCRLLPTPTNLILRRLMPNARWTQEADAKYELRWWDHDRLANIPYFQGSYLLLRTSAALAIGGFDERFFIYGEDIDLCRRLHQKSATVYVPDVEIIHEYRRYSSRSLRGTWYGIQNNCRYFNKWGWFFDGERRRVNRKVIASLKAGTW
jgi:GT2 family glycosyltransferase